MTRHRQLIGPNRKKHTRRRIAWRKFLVVLSCLAFLGLIAAVALAAAGYHVYQNRAYYANRYLDGLSKEYEISFASLDVGKNGVVAIEDLVVKGRSDGIELARMEQLQLTYEWKTLRNEGKFNDLKMRGGHIRLGEKAFGNEKSARDEEESIPVPLSHLMARIKGRVEIGDMDWIIDHPKMPPLRARGSIRSPSFNVAANGLSQDAIELRFSDIVVGDEGVFGSIDRFEATGRISVDLLRIELDSLRLVRPSLTVVPEWFIPDQEPDSGDPPPRKASEKLDVTLGQLLVEDGEIQLLGFDGSRAELKVIPDLNFRFAQVDWPDLSLRQGRFDSAGPLELKVDQLSVKGGRAELLAAEGILFKTRTLGAVAHDGQLLFAGSDKIAIHISDDSLALWREQPKERSNHAKSEKGFRVSEIALPDAHVLISEFTPIERSPWPRVEADVRTVFKDVTFDRRGMHSSAPLQGTLEHFVLHGPGVDPNEDPLLKFPGATVSLTWDDFAENAHLEQLTMNSPVVTFTDKALGEWAGKMAGAAAREMDAAKRKIYRVKNLEVTEGTLLANSPTAFSGVIPKIQGAFSLANDQIGQDLGDYGYRLKIHQFQLSNHPQSASAPSAGIDSLFPADFLPAPGLKSEQVITVEEAHVDFTAAGLQQDRKIKKVKLAKGALKIGEGFRDVVNRPRRDHHNPLPDNAGPMLRSAPTGYTLVRPKPPFRDLPDLLPLYRDPVEVKLGGGPDHPTILTPEPMPDLPPLNPLPLSGGSPLFKGERTVLQANADSEAVHWQIEDLEISGAKINIESVIPQMNGLSFGLETRMKDIPLTPGGLIDADKIQSVQIGDIEIRDPYDSFLIVAKLPDLFVEFSLAGLARREIEKIDVIRPTLNVGESLFRWVDYLRKQRAINEGGSVDVRGGVIGTGVKRENDWLINEINANAGKLVIAPYGTPITSLPFPFSATTNVGEGKLKLSMNIPDDQSSVYHIPDYGVELMGLTGTLGLNLPIPDKNNNLVQTFTLKEAKWRKFRARQMFLTVTFDRYGIYGLFGGEAYGGYANGAFNYYLDKNGNWDAWMAGTSLDTEAVTKELIPGGFAMGGKIHVKIFSGGVDSQVNEITGEISAAGGGWFDLQAMEKALEKLPAQWNSLQKGLAQIAVDSLKRFDYKEGSGELKLKDDDGHLKLQFKGDFGSRNLNLHIHDWRNSTKTATGKP